MFLFKYKRKIILQIVLLLLLALTVLGFLWALYEGKSLEEAVTGMLSVLLLLLVYKARAARR